MITKKFERKSIWIITEYYFPNENTTSYLLGLVANGLAEYHDVNVITSTSGKEEIKDSVNIFRAINPPFNKNNLYLRTVKHIISGFFLLLKAIQLIKKGDEVFVVTDPATSVFFVRILKVFRPFKLTFLVHDLFPENLLVINATRKNRLIYKIILKLYNWSFIGADRLFVIGRDMECLIKEKLKTQCPPIYFVPNFADVNKIVPMPREENLIIEQNFLKNKFIVLFTGNIGRLQGIQNLLESMLLLKENNEIHLLMIGDGAYKKMVQDFIKYHDLTNITLINSMERKYSNDFLNAGDIGLVTLIKNCLGTAVPSKTYTYMAAGKPIFAIMDEDAEISTMIDEYTIGWKVNPDFPEKFAGKLLEISKQKDEIKLRGEKSRKICCEYYSVEKAITNFLNIIN